MNVDRAPVALALVSLLQPLRPVGVRFRVEHVRCETASVRKKAIINTSLCRIHFGSIKTVSI